MSDARTVARNTMFLFAAQAVVIVVGILSLRFTLSYLGAADYGVLTFAQSFTTLFGTLMDIGIGTLMTRDVSRDRSLAQKYLGNVISIKILLGIGMLILIVLAINLMGRPPEVVQAVYIIAFTVVFTSLTQAFYSIFQAYEKMEYQSIALALTNVLILGGTVAAIYLHFRVLGFAAMLFISYLLVLVYCIVVCARSFVLPRLMVDLAFWKATVAESLPFGVSAFFGVIFFSVGAVLLELMKGNEAVGLYNAAFRLFTFILFIPQILGSALFPAMSKFYLTSKDSLRFAFEKYFKYMAIVAIPMGIGTTLLADRIIYFLAGDGYGGSIVVLRVLIWAAVFIFLSNAYGFLLNSANMQRTSVKVAGACMVLNVALNLALIPLYSYVGASAATVLTELASLAMYVAIGMTLGYRLPGPLLYDMARMLVAGAAMGIFVTLFREQNLLLLVVAAAAVYFAALLLVRCIGKDDMELIRSIIPLHKKEKTLKS